MKRNISKKLNKRKNKITRKLKKRNWENQPRPMLSASNIYYDIDGRQKGINNGGIGVIHQLAGKSGLVHEINDCLSLLKRHLPYHESDHILNIAYNLLAGGQCLQDIELLRNDEAWLNALGAEIIPDPTTAGDFLRRFDQDTIIELMEAKNTIRQKIWQTQPKSFRKQAVINVDGTINPTLGECKQGMDISYNGQWGYHPLVVSLDNTREPLYIVNRSGNVPSHLGSAVWIDKSLDLVCNTFKNVKLRGDTDFSLTEHFDKWDRRCMFIFGVDAMPNLVKIANNIAPENWQLLEKTPKYDVKTETRQRPTNVKEQVVIRRKFKNIQTESEHLAEFTYKPGKCAKSYRMTVLRKTLKVTKGELKLFDDIRYFFYITNDTKKSLPTLLEFYRGRADHENDIEQLKNGVRAIQSPSDTLNSNWAYMVIASLAWDLKAWYGMLLPYRPIGLQIMRMEFKRFINTFIRIPCLIIKTGRRICYSLVGYNAQLRQLLNFSDMLKSFSFQ